MKTFKKFVSKLIESTKAEEDSLRAIQNHAEKLSKIANKRSDDLEDHDENKPGHDEASKLHLQASSAHHAVMQHLSKLRDDSTGRVDNLINLPRKQQTSEHQDNIKEVQRERNGYEDDLINHGYERDSHASASDFHQRMSW